MTSQRTTLTRLAALGGAAALVVSGATGVAGAQNAEMGSLTEGSLEPYISFTTSVSDSLADPDTPTAPTSVTDLVGEVTGSLVDLTDETTGSAVGSVTDSLEGAGSIEVVNGVVQPGIEGSLGELITLVPGSLDAVAGSAAASPTPVNTGSAIPVQGSLGQYLYPSAIGSLAKPSVMGSLTEAGEEGSLTDILTGTGSLEDAPTGSLAPFGLPYVPAGSLAVLFDLAGTGSIGDALNSGLGALSGSLGVAPGSLTGLLPVLSVAGLVAGGVALAGGVQLPALPPIVLPPLPAGSALPAPFAPVQQEAPQQ